MKHILRLILLTAALVLAVGATRNQQTIVKDGGPPIPPCLPPCN